MRPLRLNTAAMLAAVAGLGLAAVAEPGWAQNNEVAPGDDPILGDDRADIQLDYIPVELGAFETASVRRILVVIDDQLYGAELDGAVIRRNEDRIGLDGVPLLGDVTRFSYSSDLFTPQGFAGSAGLVGDALVLNVNVAPDARPWLSDAVAGRLAAVLAQPPLVPGPGAGVLTVRTVVTLNGDYSYVIAGSLIRPLAAPPAGGQPRLGALPIIGRLFTATNTDHGGRELLVLISPAIVE